jgi:hypothetical protein
VSESTSVMLRTGGSMLGSVGGRRSVMRPTRTTVRTSSGCEGVFLFVAWRDCSRPKSIGEAT